MKSSNESQVAGWELNGADRERYVRSMFDEIAKPYDRLNRVISLGRDQRWRKAVVASAQTAPGDSVVDLGTGTGDLGISFAEHVGPTGRVIGLDLAPEMLRVAKGKRGQHPWYTLHRASAAATGVPASWAHTVSMGWVLRNVGDRSAVYREILRILRPGGTFVCIDMSKPTGLFSRVGFWSYRHAVMPILAKLSGGEGQAYKYLAGSTDHFPGANALTEELKLAGFQNAHHKPLMMGSLAIHIAQKP